MSSPRHNPFRTSRIEALPFRNPQDLDDDAFVHRLLERWQSLGRRGALVGPKGHGKTTLLEHLERRLAAQGFEIRRHPTEGVREGVVISIDGLDLLGPFTWWRLRRSLRAAGGLLATCHRPGRLPTLYEHRSTPELLRTLVRELLNDTEFLRVQPRLDELFVRHHGNVRECLRELYNEFAMDKRRYAPWR